MTPKLLASACALVACAALGPVHAQEASEIVVTGKRAHRVSKGATGLPLEIKDTPQTISTIDRQEMADFGATDSNQALRLGTGLNVEQYETNRAVYNARGFEVQLTQVDGLGMSNDWGTVVGQMDTFLFERIELIRGANGLLTGVGNSSGTINYVRKRPTNRDGAQLQLTAGSHERRRAAIDTNKVLAADGSWAGRVVIAHDDKDSHLRALHDKRTTLYGVVDGQVGGGVLTLGLTYQEAKQRSPMWGSLMLNRADGSQAEFDVSSSTSQDWTYWNTRSRSAFVEYTHGLGADWEARLTYNHRRSAEDTRLLYAYVPAPGTGLNPDNTGLTGWPYRSHGSTDGQVLDANLSGQFGAFGRRHSLLAGISHSRQKYATDLFALPSGYTQLPLPAFPYAGDAYPEPQWGPQTPESAGRQQLMRLYAASRLALTDRLKGILGLNAIHLKRDGASIYGSGSHFDGETTRKLSPYIGFTYDITREVLGYASYSDIFQNQDQSDIAGRALAPMKGRNIETGVKAEWLDKKFLTTFAVFGAEQQGLATYAGTRGSTYYYEPKDVKSRGFEFEATGRITPDTRLTLGLTRLKLSGPDGRDIYEWVPRTTANLRAETRTPLPGLRLGLGGRWQSEVHRNGGPRQQAYLVTNAFAAYELTPAATLRLNLDNLFDRKYIGGLAYGALYGAPRTAALTLEYTL